MMKSPYALDALGFAILWLLIAAFPVRGNVQEGGIIGINYGTNADNLPPPSEVAQFLLHNTMIRHVKLFDANPEILQAFAQIGIAMTVTIPNNLIPELATISYAQQWLTTNILPHIPSTNITRILVGNEIIPYKDQAIIAGLVPAMQNLNTALVMASLDHRIKVSTPHPMSIVATAYPPSAGKFGEGYDTAVLRPLLDFLRATRSPFMVNPYPYFGCNLDNLDYALFRPNNGILDVDTKLNYTNMLDAQLDSVYSAMSLLGYSDVDIVISETGWPSQGDPDQVGVDPTIASTYNKNLVKHVTSGLGTPLMPNRTFETYIFALFNENLKPGRTSERNFGLFHPDFTPVYHSGIQQFEASRGVSSGTREGIMRRLPIASLTMICIINSLIRDNAF